MKLATPCAGQETIRQYVDGTLASPLLEALELHLAGCDGCAEQMRDLLGTDPVLRVARCARAQPGGRGEVVPPALINRLVRLWSPATTTTPLFATDPTPPPGDADPEADLRGLLHAPQGPDELGRLGTYKILRILGQGGMGVVCLAEDTQLCRPVALKLMRRGLSAGAEHTQRFLREARALAAVKDDHVVTVYGVGTDGDVPFLAMEYLEGESLQSWLARCPSRPLTEVLRIAREMAQGLAAAHARGCCTATSSRPTSG